MVICLSLHPTVASGSATQSLIGANPLECLQELYSGRVTGWLPNTNDNLALDGFEHWHGRFNHLESVDAKLDGGGSLCRAAEHWTGLC